MFREATEADVEVLVSFRNDPDVNHFMVGFLEVEHALLAEEWRARP